MLLWIGANTGYNVDIPHPGIKLVSQTELEYIYTHGTSMDQGAKLHAFYDTVENIIYLPDTFDLYHVWNQGVLMHELLHYVQDQNQVKFQCPAEMEREVWPLQRKYLWEYHGVRWEYDEMWYRCPAPAPRLNLLIIYW